MREAPVAETKRSAICAVPLQDSAPAVAAFVGMLGAGCQPLFKVTVPTGADTLPRGVL